MGDAYWRYAQARQPAALLGKHPHPNLVDGLGGHELTSYYGRDAARGAPGGMREGDSMGASYERYLGGRQLGGLPTDDPRAMGIGADLTVARRQLLGVRGGRTETLHPHASKTLFVKGYEDARLVIKDSRRRDASVLCFVDFLSPAHAAIAMDALQGYRFDEQDRDSVSLRLQFAHSPGARSGAGHRGRH